MTWSVHSGTNVNVWQFHSRFMCYNCAKLHSHYFDQTFSTAGMPNLSCLFLPWKTILIVAYFATLYLTRLTCQSATRPMGQEKRGLPLIGHKSDTGWQGRLIHWLYLNFCARHAIVSIHRYRTHAHCMHMDRDNILINPLAWSGLICQAALV